MKQRQSTFGEKDIKTPSLLIKKNIMTWNDTMIQLSNVSLITAANIDSAPFPIWTALAILAGVAFFGTSATLGILLLALGGVTIYFWYTGNEKRKEGAILTIRMNSGHNLHFTFEDKKFLLRVVNVLENIIIDGGSNSQVTIDIKNCEITNSSLFSNIST